MLSTTTITGRLTATPQLRQSSTGKDVTALRVAVSDHRLGDETRYVDIAQWDRAAHYACAHLTVGQEIAAEGLLDARPYSIDGGELRIDWTLLRPRVEWGSKPLRGVSTNRMMDEARRRREALQDAPSDAA
jgi:single-stranded DNA-binding protein